ncbi:hypothetical protein ASZ90_009801 [hydrocarbon metagenome]|uniref:Uncharacterized protein n=1 Tax=hydrocarbon metagenome TaxID=938273 RepID=A0A0W8FHX9_9ZZZZ
MPERSSAVTPSPHPESGLPTAIIRQHSRGWNQPGTMSL